ncbi:DNA-directed RNA polymerase sigma-E/Sigma-24/FecI [Acetobacter nitrogenifigens DSM 23921 = NBRC 105050]|uniref:RNA polymerase sigma factor n=1 Tax=Acetobacter nitrogenifigens DSM 23921 = NBRC 105050 TaxID=1120919 RepID=A0A511X8F4_9PROT|nr:sigma-70 family RNA polymerase sigma factor [Acetobacter nitrogenifigens]GBQ89737.1 DNA-directed RNA polymerase sigma-E/Sigma-24/FecI [Acetobacter nitrogenifigens DSM 23921 = NBRC 105050]GEN59225.1 RNA polymerase sigma factor [Acetobacter nitrogenifigens DSM 23921 = NBRC 105050]
MADTFHTQVIAILPKLRVQALALTRNRAAAEDLVQDAVCNALSARESFVPGTNFGAWMHRILRNRFISDLRKQRNVTDIEDVPASLLSTKSDHEDRLAVKDLAFALARLPEDQREALVLVVLQGMSYQELAELTGCAVGTAKSRVFRARRQLEAWMVGDLPADDKLRQRAVALRDEANRRTSLARAGVSNGSGAALG